MIGELQTRAVVGLAWLVVLTTLVGCTDPADDRSQRDAAVYVAVIEAMIEAHGPQREESDAIPVVYVDAFDPSAMSLEVQVAVVAGFLDRYNIRFIDDLDEVTDAGAVNAPVRDDLLLIGLGPIATESDDEQLATLRAERYHDLDDIVAYRFTVAFERVGTPDRPEVWTVIDEPELVEPEGFLPTQ